MQIDGSIVTEQGVTFAIVIVKPHVLQTQATADVARQSFARIADFAGLPIILAAQHSDGRMECQGRPDIVRFLGSVQASQIPWKRYSVVAR